MNKAREEFQHKELTPALAQKLGDLVPGAVYLFHWFPDGHSQVDYISDGIQDIYGCTAEEMYEDVEIGHRVIHPDDRPAFDESIVASSTDLRPWRCEYRVLAADGRLRHVSAAANLKKQDDGSVLWFGHLIDVTQFKEEQLRLYRTAKRYQKAIEEIGDGVWFYNVATQQITFSDSWWRMTGYDEHSLGNSLESWKTLIHPEDLEMVLERTAALFKGDVPTIQVEYRIRTRDGNQRWILGRGVASEVSDDGAPSLVSGTYMDVTERKESERRLRLRAQVIEAVPIGVFVMDATVPSYPIRFANQMLCDIYEATRDEVIGAGWDFLAGEENQGRIRRLLSEALEGGKETEGLWRFGRSDGELVWRKLTVVPVDANTPSARLIGLVEDVSEDIRVREDLVRAKEEAVAASEAKSNFLAHVSHELRTPLHGIMGLAELGLDDARTLPNNKGQFREIYRGAEHLLRLIGDVIDLSAIEAGRVALSIEAVQIPNLVAETLRLAVPQADRKGISVMVDERLRDDALLVSADGTRLKQVLLNLLSNGVKYNRPHGAVSLKRMPTAEGRIRIAVSDTGPGLEEKDLNRLFEPFDRLGREFSQIEGSGIGLLIAKGLVEAMGGTIGVQSEINVGSTFWVDLPVGNSASPVWKSAGQPEDRVVAIGRGLPVLVAEDNPLSQSVFRSQLERLGFKPDVVGDGVAAWDAWDASRYSLVITDVHMPGMNGYELAQKIRAKEAQTTGTPTYIIGASANALKEAAREAAEYGMDDYVTKPLTLVAFRDALLKMPQFAPTAGQQETADKDARADVDRSEEHIDEARANGHEAILDLQVLRDLVGDDPLTVDAFVERFLESSTTCMDELRQATLDGAWSGVGEAAHKLKGSARSLGASRLARVCESLERLASQAEAAEIKEYGARLGEAYREVVQAIESR